MANNDDDAPKKKKAHLRAVGFCGADDSVHPYMLGILSQAYPFVEFGVLFRPDKQGQPRYASEAWVRQLAQVAKQSGGTMRLAAHLCGTRVNEVLNGNGAFLSTLAPLGFQRVQINATAVNGVDTSRLAESVPNVCDLVERYTNLEFILQKNEETRPLWEGLLQRYRDTSVPPNVSMLVDESKGTGVLASSWPSPPIEHRIGYAGGIGPHNIEAVLRDVMEAGQGHEIWIDMESSLRSNKNGKDVFDLDKCYQVILATCQVTDYKHPSYLE